MITPGLRSSPLALAMTVSVCLVPFPTVQGQDKGATAVGRTILAEVVAIDQPYFYNRLGSHAPNGMIFALKRDVVTTKDDKNAERSQLRTDKRPRPLVLRVNVGDCLEIRFTNLLTPDPPANAPTTRYASVFVAGMDLLPTTDDKGNPLPGIASSASNVGKNVSSLAAPGETRVYRYYARAEGTFLLSSYADTTTGAGGQAGQGLFGAVNVQPRGAEYYRSQVTRQDLRLATYKAEKKEDGFVIPGRSTMALSPLAKDSSAPPEKGSKSLPPVPKDRRFVLMRQSSSDSSSAVHVGLDKDNLLIGETGHPLIDYQAVYPKGQKHATMPILNMLRAREEGKEVCSFAPDPKAKTVAQLEWGVISDELKNSLKLGDDAVVGDQDGAAWLITDGAAVYSVRARAGKVIARKAQLEIVHSDLTAVITGPRAGRFPLSNTSPSFAANPANPDRRQPYREYTIVYHQAPASVQAFADHLPVNSANVAALDQFGINYGIAGIGAEIMANRLGVGPMGNRDSVDLKFEEFFLSSWAVGDPAILVDNPAGAQVPAPPEKMLAKRTPQLQARDARAFRLNPDNPARRQPRARKHNPAKATQAFFPDDPSNVYHSYMSDHVKFRILHAGPGPSHVHHLHAHQWLHTPNSDNSSYLDSQLIIPGIAYTLDIAYGSGNRNKTVGDSIFHCHFYPHFAAGMWSLWRVHDVFEEGTELNSRGQPKVGSRALPDGELTHGTPIPAIVPLPTLAMAPLPAKVKLVDAGRRAEVEPSRYDGDGTPVYDRNPGYPFFIPGVSGHRAPHPPLDFASKTDGKTNKKEYLDGGLPRHLVLGGEVIKQYQTRWDFTKDFVLYDSEKRDDPNRKLVAGSLTAFQLPEQGTALEKVAMATHSRRTHSSIQPNGLPGNFVLNGLPGVSGAPYAPPYVDDQGNAQVRTRRYQAAVLQMDVVLSKKGWHYPQQRFMTLWEDVKDTVQNKRAPEPLFFRANSGESIEFWHTNLVPSYYEVDDFQVRTPTDVLGQHIHLVKFDVTASDGAGNGFNYEDGTFSPDEVRERIDAINAKGGLYAFDSHSQFKAKHKQLPRLRAKDYRQVYTDADGNPLFGEPPAGQNWNGAQTTIQRWHSDPLLNNQGVDRTLRTVFTHDHFGPSTHQQIGLYAGLLVEPEGSKWYLPQGERMGTRRDGGPTSWNGFIVPPDKEGSYREFALEFQDTQLAYDFSSKPAVSPMPADAALFHLPVDEQKELKPGPVSDVLRMWFELTGGIQLTSRAVVSVVTQDKEWLVTDQLVGKKPIPASAVVKYPIKLDERGSGVNKTKALFVFTPSVPPGWVDPDNALAPPKGSADVTLNGAPFPQIISSGNAGIMSMNYRAESAALRIAIPKNAKVDDPKQTDLAYALSSDLGPNSKRLDPDLNRQPVGKVNGFARPFPPALQPLTADPDKGGVTDADPYTPLLRAYANDRVQVRTLVGAHFDSHSFQVSGNRWLFEPSDENSGYRNAQGMGLSEHFEMRFRLPRTTTTAKRPFTDHLYSASSDSLGFTYGLWGHLRAYDKEVGESGKPDYLAQLPNNKFTDQKPPRIDFAARYEAAKKAGRPTCSFDVTAVNGSIVYNNRGKLGDDKAVFYVRTSDLDLTTNDKGEVTKVKLKPGVPVGPLVLRAAAGCWIKMTLRNGVDPNAPVFTGQTTKYNGDRPAFNAGIPKALGQVGLPVSTNVGLHPSLLAYDATAGDGRNVGYNPVQTVPPPDKDGKMQTPRVSYWYAGLLEEARDGSPREKPVEFGAVNLLPAEPVRQHQTGLYGALVIEPKGSTWVEDAGNPAVAVVTTADGRSFREAVLQWQNDVQLFSGGLQGAINYRTETLALRGIKKVPPAPKGFADAFSNAQVGGDPETPVVTAPAGMPTRFRMLASGCSTNALANTPPTIVVQGHSWQEEPFVAASMRIGHNRRSQHFGAQQMSSGDALNLVLPSAGGVKGVPGDYLYHGYQRITPGNDDGTWGLFRVKAQAVVIRRAGLDEKKQLFVEGFNTRLAKTGKYAAEVQVLALTLGDDGKEKDRKLLATVKVDQNTGRWTLAPSGDVTLETRTVLGVESPVSDEDKQEGLARVVVVPSGTR